MQTLAIEPQLPYILPTDAPIVVALVGCGGTGSHLAQALARIAYHCRAAGLPEVEICCIDGDSVEQKNVGRQLFAPAEVGQNKAQTLAGRLSAALGLCIQAVPRMATAGLLCNEIRPPARAIGILVGAVDSAEGRTALAESLNVGSWRLWLDCGNHERSGQVCVGTATNTRQLRGALAVPGLCSALPAPSLLYPELLRAPVPRPQADCAQAMALGAQSLLVNQAMAAVAGEYLYHLIVKRRLTQFETVIDLESLTMRSTPITTRTLVQASGMSERELTLQPKQKGRAA